MFRKKVKQENLDIQGLNEAISTTNRILRISFGLIIIAVVALSLYLLRSLHVFKIIRELLIVISPVFIGIIIAWLLDPLVTFLTNKKIPRILSCLIVYFVFIGILVLLFVLMMPSFIEQIKDFVSAIPSFFIDAKNFVSNIVNRFSHNYDINLSSIKSQIFSNFEVISNHLTTNLPDMLLSFGRSLVSGGMFLILGLMIGFYMLYDFNKVSSHFIEVLPVSWRSNALELCDRINHSLRGYVTGVLTVMFLVFVTQSIGLSIVGLKAPLVFALFCAITDVIPYFGPYIGAIPAVLVAFSTSPLTGIFCIIAIVIVQLIENNFYQPLIMGHAMKLHPVTIMVGLLIFEHFFGIIGMIVATPVIAVFKIIFLFFDEKQQLMKKLKGEENIEEEK